MLLVPPPQTLMVCADRSGMQGYVRSPLPEIHDNGIRLLLKGHPRLPLAFCQDSAPQGQGHVPPIIQHLLQHCASPVVGGVCEQDEPSVRIHEMQTHCG